MTHTKGPWNASPYSSVVGIAIMAQPDKTKNSFMVAGVMGERSAAEANARLIAAAPELLEALKFAAVIIGHPDDAGSKYIQSVIAKATQP